MAEGSSSFALVDARQFLYLPHWVKVWILAAASLLLLLAGVSVYLALAHNHAESLVFYLSVAQSATLVLIFFLVVTFSRRDANADQLHLLTDEFLRRYITGSLSKVSIPDLGLQGFKVYDEGAKDIFGRLLKMSNGDYTFQLWVGLNVRRLFVIYFLPFEGAMPIDGLEHVFQFTFGGAKKVGYDCNYEQATVRGEKIVSIWLTADTEGDFLSSPQEKLFWAQDIAMMTESFLRTAHRNKISLVLKSISPGPL